MVRSRKIYGDIQWRYQTTSSWLMRNGSKSRRWHRRVVKVLRRMMMWRILMRRHLMGMGMMGMRILKMRMTRMLLFVGKQHVGSDMLRVASHNALLGSEVPLLRLLRRVIHPSLTLARMLSSRSAALRGMILRGGTRSRPLRFGGVHRPRLRDGCDGPLLRDDGGSGHDPLQCVRGLECPARGGLEVHRHGSTQGYVRLVDLVLVVSAVVLVVVDLRNLCLLLFLLR
mmetsp:Transcript_42281/g.88795  ORF Transcript_42281/g.88795 Transcript_42281/m.88795 type:complete len:227 (+) Transcript_42281:1007-1687(+)